MGHHSQTLGLGGPVWSWGLDMMVLVGSCQHGVFYENKLICCFKERLKPTMAVT